MACGEQWCSTPASDSFKEKWFHGKCLAPNCQNPLTGRGCSWHPHPAEVAYEINYRKLESYVVLDVNGSDIRYSVEEAKVKEDNGSYELTVRVSSRSGQTRDLNAKDLMHAVCRYWGKHTVSERLPQLETDKERAAYARSCAFAFTSPGQDLQSGSRRKALILDARLRNYIALVQKGWSPADIYIVEELPLTALYEEVLGAKVVLGRLEKIIMDPPAEPRGLREHVQNTVAIYVDVCGDFVGAKWKVKLESALKAMPHLEAYMVTQGKMAARNPNHQLGEVPRLDGFQELNKFDDQAVRCWYYRKGVEDSPSAAGSALADKRRIYLKQEPENNEACNLGVKKEQDSEDEWQDDMPLSAHKVNRRHATTHDDESEASIRIPRNSHRRQRKRWAENVLVSFELSGSASSCSQPDMGANEAKNAENELADDSPQLEPGDCGLPKELGQEHKKPILEPVLPCRGGEENLSAGTLCLSSASRSKASSQGGSEEEAREQIAPTENATPKDFSGKRPRSEGVLDASTGVLASLRSSPSSGSGGESSQKRPFQDEVNTLWLGQRCFASVDSLRVHVRDILRHAMRGRVGWDHEAFLIELFQFHPQAESKLRSGVSEVWVDASEKSIMEGNASTWDAAWCFWVHRYDGSWDDISYLKCIAALNEQSSQRLPIRVPRLRQRVSYART